MLVNHTDQIIHISPAEARFIRAGTIRSLPTTNPFSGPCFRLRNNFYRVPHIKSLDQLATWIENHAMPDHPVRRFDLPHHA